MTYASRDDLNAAHGPDQVARLAARPGIEDDTQTVARALSDVASVIDARLSVRFTLPLPVVPEILRTIAVDLVIARLAAGDGGLLLTDDLKHRETQARADLKAIADGTMNLGLPAANQGERPKPIVTSTGGKLFTRPRLRGF
ncbi:phage protein Gp36 family protein [Brevundimonas faecalis]|uniref:phage protein Gp36 family protein n=1 Tax=Brevundimonas faecalis TaxID=947378 RepID=UPI003620BC84